MKPRIGVYLSEQMAFRLTAAAKLRGASKSALIEAALAQFLGSDDVDNDNLPMERRLTLMSHQLERLDQHIRAVNETVALQARFQLAVAPQLPAAALSAACALGAERFDEFAAQVGRRVQSGSSLLQETMDRLGQKKDASCAVSRAMQASLPNPEHHQRTPAMSEINVERSTAAREGGRLFNFPGKSGIPLH